MKRILFVLSALLIASLAANAQSNNTKAVRISNGCGSESSKLSQIGSKIANPVDALVTGTTIKQQKESCDQHDKDYYNYVNKACLDSENYRVDYKNK